MEDKKSTYTEAQKKATKKYRENNKDKVKEQRKTYYQKRKDRDPGFLEYKRLNARKYYLKKKGLKTIPEVKEPESEPESLVVEEVKEPEKVEEVKFERYNFFEEPEKEEVKEPENKPSAKRKRVYRKK